MSCNPEIHAKMITMEYVECPFCDPHLKQPSTKHIPCCNKQNMINNEGMNLCKSCGTVNDYQTAKDFINFYENKYKIVKKSIYYRKYHRENIIAENKINSSYHEKIKIHKILVETDKILPQININRKRMININFIIKKIFEILKKPCDNIQITKSKNTLKLYQQYWTNIQSLIGDKIKSIVE